ncbi:MAG: hypothetical protein HQK60_12715 [Deltaproteobacteria bacterium]|nr:hypothetical protein [Deltaproteobacteria bacterium]
MQLFDSLSVYEQLKHTTLDDETCLRLSEILRDSQTQQLELLTTKLEFLATKKDIEVLRAETKKDIEMLRAETKKDIEILRAETQKNIADAKNEIIKWVVGLIATQTALIAGMLTAAVTIILKMIK